MKAIDYMSIFAYNNINGGETKMDPVEILKALADETRMRILNLLRFGQLCVCEIEDILEINQSNASRHLTKLKGAKIIVAHKQSQWVYYSLNQKLLTDHPFIRVLLEQELERDDCYRRDKERWHKFQELGGDCAHKIVLEA